MTTKTPLERMQFLIDLLQAELDRMRSPLSAAGKRRGRPPKEKPMGGRMGWPADPEARKAEARRRMKVAAKRKAAAMKAAA